MDIHVGDIQLNTKIYNLITFFPAMGCTDIGNKVYFDWIIEYNKAIK